MALRTPEQLIEALASNRGMVTPVPSYYPLGAGFTAQCVREAYRDVIDLVTDVATQHRGSPEAVAALKQVTEQVAEALRAE